MPGIIGVHPVNGRCDSTLNFIWLFVGCLTVFKDGDIFHANYHRRHDMCMNNKHRYFGVGWNNSQNQFCQYICSFQYNLFAGCLSWKGFWTWFHSERFLPHSHLRSDNLNRRTYQIYPTGSWLEPFLSVLCHEPIGNTSLNPNSIHRLFAYGFYFNYRLWGCGICSARIFDNFHSGYVRWFKSFQFRHIGQNPPIQINKRPSLAKNGQSAVVVLHPGINSSILPTSSKWLRSVFCTDTTNPLPFIL